MALFIPGESPQNGLYGEAPFFKLQVYKRLAISLAEVYDRVGKCVISVCKKAQKDYNRLTITLFIFPSKKTYFA